MGQRYSHLTPKERCRLCGMMEMGLPKAEMAQRLGRDRATIYREIARNCCANGHRPNSAARQTWACELQGSQIGHSTRLREHVEDLPDRVDQRRVRHRLLSPQPLPGGGRLVSHIRKLARRVRS